MNFLNKITAAISRVTTAISASGLAVTAVCLVLQVLFRIMHYTATWTSEIARYAFMATVFYGMAAANDKGLNLVVTLLTDKMKPNVSFNYSIFTKFLIGVFLCIITYGVFVTANTASGNNQTFEAFTNIKICYLYYFIDIGLFISTFNTLVSVIKDIFSAVKHTDETQNGR